MYYKICGFPSGSVIKNLPANGGDTGDLGSTPELGRSPEVGSGNPLQCSCLENPMDRGAWQATVHGLQELNMTERLRIHTHIYVRTYVYVCVYVYIYMCVCVYIYMYVCMYILASLIAQLVKNLSAMKETAV